MRAIPSTRGETGPGGSCLAPALVMAVLVTAVLAIPGCNEPASPRAQLQGRSVAADRCTAQPLAPFDCAEIGGTFQTSLRFSGTVAAIEAPDEFGRWHIGVREPSGAEHRLAYQAPDQPPPVETGHAYDFEIDRAGGMPPASGLIVRDAEGLVFAGASDQGIGDHVLAGGIPGVGLRLLPPACASRGAGDCFEAAFNQALEVSRADERVELVQGERVTLGGYDVRCLIAQQVKYNTRCRDFAMVAVSYTVARMK